MVGTTLGISMDTKDRFKQARLNESAKLNAILSEDAYLNILLDQKKEKSKK